MSEIFFGLKKPEVYSFDEIAFLYGIVLHSDRKDCSICEKLNNMKMAIEKNKDNTAVFFMPEATYDIFSVFQGQNAICDFSYEDTHVLLEIVTAEKNGKNSKIAKHIAGKLGILNDFLKAGNAVVPVASAASEFITL